MLKISTLNLNFHLQMQLSLSVRHSITDNALELEITGVFFCYKRNEKRLNFPENDNP